MRFNREDLIRDIQERYRQSGRSLNEFERRHWAATEAKKLGWGGITLVSQALRISPNTIKRGIQEIAAGHPDLSSSANARIRKPGGGRKSKKSSSAPVIPELSTRDSSTAEAHTSDVNFFDADRDLASVTHTDMKSTSVDDIASSNRPNQPTIP